MRVLVASFAILVSPLLATDQVLFKNGARISGTILGQSKDHVFMRMGNGNVVYSKKAILRIYDDITNKEPLTRVLKRDELPPWWIPLSDLYHSDWVNALESIPAGRIDSGSFANVPYLSFRANGIYELNIYGNPEDPAALEIGFRGKNLRSRDALKRCRQFMMSYLSGMRQLQTLYALDEKGGSRSVGGLDLTILPPTAPDAYGGWWISIANSEKLKAARKSDEKTWRIACDQDRKEVAKWTDGETSWKKYSLSDALKRYLPMERVEER